MRFGSPMDFILVEPASYLHKDVDLAALGFEFDHETNRMNAPFSVPIVGCLKTKEIPYERETSGVEDLSLVDSDKCCQYQAVRRWFYNDWCRIEPKLRTSIVEGISVFLSLFDDNPAVKRTFCPPKECYDPEQNREGKYGVPLPPFAELIEQGVVCALNFPVSMNPGLARAIGNFMKLDFERAVLNRIPLMESNPGRHFRQVLCLCDEYHAFATVGENDPTGDEKFFLLERAVQRSQLAGIHRWTEFDCSPVDPSQGITPPGSE